MTQPRVEHDSETAVLIAGIAIIMFGAVSVLVAVAGGWAPALILTVALGAIARYVRPSHPEARILQRLFAILAATCAAGFVFDVFIRLAG